MSGAKTVKAKKGKKLAGPSAGAGAAPDRLDTANHFVVGATIAGSGILMDEPPGRRQLLTRERALNLAAWLYVMVEAQDTVAAGLEHRTEADFKRLLQDIRRT